MNPNPDDLPQALSTRRPALLPGAIWLVPLIALLIGLGLAYQAISERGPEITLRFARAEGLEANKTRIKFKDVDIGMVRKITLSDDRRSVEVQAQMDHSATALLAADTRFWVVRPRVALGGVSGLATILSGAYIALDPGKGDKPRREFVGLEEPPLVVSDSTGRQFRLRADDLGSLDIGTPVFYRRIEVGKVVGYAMRKDGKGVDVRIFVNAPYDDLVRTGSRFWHASGIDLTIDASGVRLDTQSMVSLAVGGIAFALAGQESGAPPAASEAEFTLHPDRAAAMRVIDSVSEKFVLRFRESVRGLEVGAPVDFRGIHAGDVSRIDLEFDRANTEIVMAVEITLYPHRFARRARSQPGAPLPPTVSHEVLDRMVARGFRAQLRTANLLTGQRYVALDFFAGPRPVRVDWRQSLPELPVQPGTLDSLQDQIVSVAETLRQTLQRADALLLRLDREVAPEAIDTLRDARQTLEHANRLIRSDAPLQLEIREAMRELGRAAGAVRNLADLLERQPEALLTGKKGDAK